MSYSRTQDERAVAYRALCLGALLRRGELEIAVQNIGEIAVSDDTRNQAHETLMHRNAQLCHWVEAEVILPHFSERERYLLRKPLGAWSERNVTSVGWRTESLGTMLWALHWLDDMPDYDQQFDLEAVLSPLDILNPTIDFIWSATLREADDLCAQRDAAELWNWRSRATEIQRMGMNPPEGVTFDEIVRFTTERAVREGKLHQVRDGDFMVFNKPYAQVDDDEYALVSNIAYERYTCFSWICETSSEWESIRID